MNKRTQNNERGYGRAMDISALCDYIGCGEHVARCTAERAGAVIHLGRRVVFDRAKIDAYLDTLTGTETAQAVIK